MERCSTVIFEYLPKRTIVIVFSLSKANEADKYPVGVKTNKGQTAKPVL